MEVADVRGGKHWRTFLGFPFVRWNGNSSRRWSASAVRMTARCGRQCRSRQLINCMWRNPFFSVVETAQCHYDWVLAQDTWGICLQAGDKGQGFRFRYKLKATPDDIMQWKGHRENICCSAAFLYVKSYSDPPVHFTFIIDGKISGGFFTSKSLVEMEMSRRWKLYANVGIWEEEECSLQKKTPSQSY